MPPERSGALGMSLMRPGKRPIKRPALARAWQLVRRLREEDKRLHFVWSFWLTVAGHLVWPPGLAVAVSLLLGVGKELWDERYGSGFCWLDLVANALGIALGAAFVRLLPPIFLA